MVSVHVYLQLLNKLVQHQSHLLLLYLLYSHQTASLAVDSWKDLAESAFPLACSQLKILYFYIYVSFFIFKREVAGMSEQNGGLLSQRKGFSYSFGFF